MMRVLKLILLALLGVLGLLLVYGAAVEPYTLEEAEETGVIENLPRAWEGKRFAVISDFQAGMWLDNLSTVREAISRTVQLEPNFVVLLGDYVYKAEDAERHVRQVTELVRPLGESGIPTFAVLGVHDYGIDNSNDARDEELADQIAQAFEAVGVTVLRNQAVRIPLAQEAGEPLYLVGIGPKEARAARPQEALAEAPADAPRLVIMHNPDTFAELPPGSAPLALAGHTHGGQICLPFLPGWSWMTLVQEGEVHADGWIRGYGQAGNHLYVNRGIGFSKVPIRINCPPELTLFRLTRD